MTGLADCRKTGTTSLTVLSAGRRLLQIDVSIGLRLPLAPRADGLGKLFGQSRQPDRANVSARS